MIISFEGINFAGKTTQLALLDAHLRLLGTKTRRFAFPSRETTVGELIAGVLRGDLRISVEALFALFSANRLEHLPAINEAIMADDVVLCDRYSESEYAYGAARGLSRTWLSALESQMPVADLVVLLDIDCDNALCRRATEAPLDVFERDGEYLSLVRREYLRLSAESGTRTWLVIDATKSTREIHDCIVRAATDRIRANR